MEEDLKYVTRTVFKLQIQIHDVIEDVERKKGRKKERHLRQWKNENESCLRWDSNPRHSVLYLTNTCTITCTFFPKIQILLKYSTCTLCVSTLNT